MATRRERLDKFANFDLANQLIEQANKATVCDANCMKNRNSQNLKQKKTVLALQALMTVILV